MRVVGLAASALLVLANCVTTQPQNATSAANTPINFCPGASDLRVPSGPGIGELDSLGSAFGFAAPPLAVPPSEFCEAPTDPELVAVGGILTAAADAEKAGDKAGADKLRQQARDRLTNFRATLKLSSKADARLAALVTGYHPPAGVKLGWQAAKQMELAGDQQGAQGLLGQIRAALSDYAKGALTGPLDGPDALAIARDLQLAGAEGPDGPLTTKLLEIARSQAQKNFESLNQNLPCPPSLADLTALFQAGRQSALLGTPSGDGQPGSILGELQSASDSYIRGAAQQASGADLAKLGSQAGRAGLGDLSNQLRDGKKVDPPKCGVGVHLAFTQEYPESSTMAQGYLRAAWVFDSWSCSGFDGQWQTQITYRAVPNPAYGLGPLDLDWKAEWRPPHGEIQGGFGNFGSSIETGQWAVAMDLARNPSGATLQTTVLKDIGRSGDGFVIDNAMGWLDKKSLPVSRSAASQCK